MNTVSEAVETQKVKVLRNFLFSGMWRCGAFSLIKTNLSVWLLKTTLDKTSYTAPVGPSVSIQPCNALLLCNAV